MKANPEVVLNRMRTSILPVFVEDLKKEQKRLSSRPIDDFIGHVTALLDGIFFELVQGFGVDSMAHLGEESAVKARIYAVECLNGALPSEHPYILALLRIRDDPEWKFLTLYRAHYRKFHEMLTQNVVPLIVADSEEALAEREYEMEVVYPGRPITLDTRL